MKTEKNIQTKGKLIIKESNELVNFPAAKMSSLEKKIILLLIAQIKINDKELKKYKIPIKTLMKLSGIKNRSRYSFAQEMAISLQEKVVFIPKEEGKGFKTHSWLYGTEYVDGKGYFTAQIHPEIRPYLLELKKNFTTFHLEYILQVKSYFSIRLYEILSQFKDTGWRIISIKDLRLLIGIDKPGKDGNIIEENRKYQKYNDFKRFILERARKEINRETDLKISYEEIKQGRKIVSIKFKIKEVKKKIKTDFRKIVSKELPEIDWTKEHQKTKQRQKELSILGEQVETEKKVLEEDFEKIPDEERKYYLTRAENYLKNNEFINQNFIPSILKKGKAVELYKEDKNK